MMYRSGNQIVIDQKYSLNLTPYSDFDGIWAYVKQAKFSTRYMADKYRYMDL